MGVIISFFKTLLNWTGILGSFLTSTWGLIATSVVGFISLFAGVASDIFNSASLAVDLFEAASEAFGSFSFFLSSNSFFAVVYQALALDDFFHLCSSFLTLFFGVCILGAFEVIFAGVAVTIPFFILKVCRVAVRGLTAGTVDV